MSYITRPISSGELGKKIKSIATRSKTLDIDTQACLIQSLIQFEQHGNIDFASKIIKAMGKSQRANAAVTYLQSHAPLRAEYVGRTFKGFKKDKSDTAVPLNITQAEQVNFWDFTTEAPATVVTLESLEKRLANLLKVANENLSNDDLDKFTDMIKGISVA